MFTISGILNHVPFTLIWNAGELSGDPMAILEMKAAAPYWTVGPGGGPYWKGAGILKNGTATYLLAYQLFQDVEVIGGEVPTVPDVPAGAIP